MDLRNLIVAVLITYISCTEPPKFHEDLSPEEQVHYFGTELIEDIPQYEFTSPQRIDKRRRRDSGNDTGSDVGDQLEYLIHAFGEQIHILLEKNKDLVTPGCLVHKHKGNGTRDVVPCSMEGCFYTGKTSNDSDDSWVAASVCGGLHGVIGIGEKTMMIQPIKDQHMSRAKRDTRLDIPHIIFHYQPKKRSCGSTGSITEDSSPQNRMRRRRRRSATRRYIETAVVADKSVYNFHGKDTEPVIKTIMNIVAQRLLDPSLGAELYLAINKIVILEEDEDELEIASNSETTLTSLCHWMTTWNPAQDTNPEHADYVLLLTKTDLVFKNNHANSGLARMGMCGSGGGCSVNEDAGLGAGLTIAHETGHVLGMNHDSEDNDCTNGVNIMSTIASTGPAAFKWSKCSANYLQETLKSSGKSHCLNDAPAGTAIKSYAHTDMPGTLYSATQQCKLMVGPDAEVCPGVHAKNEDVCGGLVCRPKPNTGVNGCIIYATPRMDGTDCHDNDKAPARSWCIQAKCQPMGPGSADERDGGWSDWEPDFHACSRTCGGGVRVKRRFCNNPTPMYGGRACQGHDVTGDLCNVQPCISSSQTEFMGEQCASTDKNAIQGKTYHWVPNTGARGDDMCLLNCHAEGTSWVAKRGIAIDGTQCLLRTATTFSRCVAGKCKSFGCDGHVDSGMEYDTCGICNGQGNTCKKMTGTFKGGHAHEFTTFLTIPVGSTGITVTQGNMYCYLSAKVSGQFLFKANTPRMSGSYNRGGVTIKYQSKPEKLEIVGPITAPVEVQVFRQYDPPYVGVDPEIYYEYHVPESTRTTLYMWKTKAGRCTKSCGTGTQVPTITCEGPSGTVEDFHCNINDKPAEVPQECNTHACPPRWSSSEWSHCSKSCGGGQRHRKVECVQENRNVETVLGEQACHGQTKPSSSSSCGNDKCPGTWKAGEWTRCSATCARGLKTRTVRCYSSQSSNTPLEDADCLAASKPAMQDNCLVKPCRMDIKGDACVDKKENCFGSYGDQICTNEYKGWAHDNCMKSCGVCVENPSDYDPNCKDETDSCSMYAADFCTDSKYLAFAKKNCKKFCSYCEAAVATTSDPNCKDSADNCAAYGESVCTQYAAWAKTHCQRTCNQCPLQEHKAERSGESCKDDTDCEAFGSGACTVTEFARQHCPKFCGLCKAACDDAKENCAAYGASMCTQYKPWAQANCKGFCGLCDSRKKRSVDMIEPPLMELVPDVPTEVNEPVDDEMEDMPVTLDDDVIDEAADNVVADDDAVENVGTDLLPPPIIGGEEEKHSGGVPKEPVCRTVRTALSGTIDVTEGLEPGVMCEQTIALPLGNRVLLKFKEMNVDCEAGDVFMIVDGVSGSEIPICNSVLQNEWLASGSVVALQFMPGSQGHGYSVSYEAFPMNQTVPACSRQFTASRGDFSVFRFPTLAGHVTDVDVTCEVYIVATPGHTVQMTFSDFAMTGTAGLCEQDTGVLVQDLEGGEVDEFCGELSPFMWESNGSRVRLMYRQSSVADGFRVSYTVS